MINDSREADHVTLPDHFITIENPLPPGRRVSAIRGARGETDLLWQVRNSVADLIDGDVVLLPQIDEHPVPDVLFHNDLMVVSTRFRDAVESWLKDFEFIPTKLELWRPGQGNDLGGGPVIDGYWWLNSWRRLDIVDWDHTEASLFSEFPARFSYGDTPVKATAFRRLALKREAPPDEHFFGLLGIQSEQRYLSPQLHAHLVERRFSVRFRPVLFEKGTLTEDGRRALYRLLNPGASQA